MTVYEIAFENGKKRFTVLKSDAEFLSNLDGVIKITFHINFNNV